MDADHRALRLPDRGQLGEERGHVGVRADAQHQDVEGGHRAVVHRSGRLRQLGRVRLRRRLHVRAVRAVGGGHGVHALRVHRYGVQQCLAGLRDIALGVALGEVALVAPPQVEAAPVDGVPGGSRRQRGQQAVAVATAREDHGRGAPGGLRVHDLRDQAGRGGLRHQFLVVVDDQLRSAHFAVAFLAGAFFAVLAAAFFAGALAASSTGSGTATGSAADPVPAAPAGASAACRGTVFSRSTP